MCKKIKHPGAYLEELIIKSGMSQHELAVRTGVTDKHISTVINGTKGISATFAKKLSYVFGKERNYNFWIEKQNEYDKYQIDLAEENNIKEDEYKIFDELKEIYNYYALRFNIDIGNGKTEQIINLRKFMEVSDLTAISKISYNAAYRAQVKNNIKVNLNVVSAWQRLCELSSESIITSMTNNLNINKLEAKINSIKNEMFGNINNSISDLQKIFAECGIAFNVVKHFRGAPVQGFIKQINDDKLLLCLTIRGGFADRFWFTLFHEIGHIVNGDYNIRFVDFDSVENNIELAADQYAENTLIDRKKYENFIQTCDYESEDRIKEFAKNINVQPFIVIGRLQNDKLLEWNKFNELKPVYKWI